MIRQVESSEAIHFWASVLFTTYIVYVGSRGLTAETVLFVAVQVAFNVYPVLHLCIVRGRLSRVTRGGGAARGAELRGSSVA